MGDAFGVDRMDYLLRDSHHAGVAYGRFDHYRLIDTLRILPAPPADKAEHERMIEEIFAGLTVYDNEHGTEEEGESKEGPAKTAGASTKAPMGEPALGIVDGGRALRRGPDAGPLLHVYAALLPPRSADLRYSPEGLSPDNGSRAASIQRGLPNT